MAATLAAVRTREDVRLEGLSGSHLACGVERGPDCGIAFAGRRRSGGSRPGAGASRPASLSRASSRHGGRVSSPRGQPVRRRATARRHRARAAPNARPMQPRSRRHPSRTGALLDGAHSVARTLSRSIAAARHRGRDRPGGADPPFGGLRLSARDAGGVVGGVCRPRRNRRHIPADPRTSGPPGFLRRRDRVDSRVQSARSAFDAFGR